MPNPRLFVPFIYSPQLPDSFIQTNIDETFLILRHPSSEYLKFEVSSLIPRSTIKNKRPPSYTTSSSIDSPQPYPTPGNLLCKKIIFFATLTHTPTHGPMSISDNPFAHYHQFASISWKTLWLTINQTFPSIIYMYVQFAHLLVLILN